MDDSKKQTMQYSATAFVDILGFKNIVEMEGDKINDIFDLLSKNAEYSKKTQDKNNEILPVRYAFSDSIYLISPPAEINVLQQKADMTAHWNIEEFKNPDFEKFDFLFEEISYLMTYFSASGFFLRGGISFGDVLFNEHTFLGKAINEAYLIESTIAIYPRVVIEQSFYEKLKKYKYGKLNDFFEKDFDGCYCLKFQQEHFHDVENFKNKVLAEIIKNKSNSDQKILQKMEYLENKINNLWKINQYFSDLALYSFALLCKKL